jgi:tRNA-splicing ligase RtcB
MCDYIQKDLIHTFKHKDLVFDEYINIHHNYASLEHHFGKNLWVHRKGATLASDKTTGIIPGSMGTGSYIVRGLGNPQSLNSCSHGSGRRMGRNVFNQTHNNEEALKEIHASMEGITYTKFGRATSRKGKDLGMLDISEAPQAYKNIEDVMQHQADLVVPLYRLKPVINWKDVGDE